MFRAGLGEEGRCTEGMGSGDMKHRPGVADTESAALLLGFHASLTYLAISCTVCSYVFMDSIHSSFSSMHSNLCSSPLQTRALC